MMSATIHSVRLPGFDPCQSGGVTIAADSERELRDAAAQHAAAVHGHQETPALRAQLKKMPKPQRA
jgi:Protein of unknown function (DUF1059)